MGGMAMPKCPCPAKCGMAAQDGCKGCQNGKATAGCPNPGKCCFEAKPECFECEKGASGNCPDPTNCGYGAGGGDDCMMKMVFGFSNDVCILLADWHVTNSGEFFLAFVGILLLAAIREGMACYRVYRAASKRNKTADKAAMGLELQTPLLADSAGPAAVAGSSNQRVGLRITGMTCKNCTDTVTAALKAHKGVVRAVVSLEQGGAADVTFQPQCVTVEEIVDEVETVGYDCTVSSPIELAESGPRSLGSIGLDSALYGLGLVVSYLLMLLVMTYNVGICVAVIGGCTFFQFAFAAALRRHISFSPDSDHCCDN